MSICLLGKLTETVDSLGLANNTLMYFTSDHGGHIEDADSIIGQKGGWNSIYKGRRCFLTPIFDVIIADIYVLLSYLKPENIYQELI